MHKEVNAQAIQVSQVDLIGEYIAGKTIDPVKFSAVEGRIIDRSPGAAGEIMQPGKSLFTQPVVAGTHTSPDKKDR